MHWRDRIDVEIRSLGDGGLLDFLNSNNFQVNRKEKIRDDNHRDYFLFLRLTDGLRTKLGVTGDEILAVVLHSTTQQAWFFSETRALLNRRDRLTKTLVLVFSKDANIEAVCRRGFRDAQTRYKTCFVGIAQPMVNAKLERGEHERAFGTAVHGQAFSVDHFDARTPVPDDMFGREGLASQIEYDCRTATAGVAILGVRRAGKTSLLDRVIDQLRHSEDPWLVGRYDAQDNAIDAGATVAFQAFVRGLRKEGKRLDFELRPNATEPQDQLRYILDVLIDQHDQRVVLAIDEVEWLVPTAVQVGAEQTRAKDQDYLRLFGRLRALKQTHGHRLTLLVCGINETFCEREEYSEYPNPSLDLFKRHYASLLAIDDLVAMLQTLGARMGVRLSRGFAEKVTEAFGGHAYLARQFCSEACKGRMRPIELQESDFQLAYDSFMRERAPAVLGSVMSSLARFYPAEYELLRNIARGHREENRQEPANHLREYGLLDTNGNVAFYALRDYAATHTTDTVRANRYERLAKLGEGTTGVVYKSFDRDRHQVCAVKHFIGHNAESVAQAEWEMLTSIQSNAIPIAYELTEVDGNPAIAMEFIDGQRLDKYVGESTCDSAQIAQLVEALLKSIASLHPSTARKQELRSRFDEKTSISEEDYQRFLAALGSGFLHRDLKPANIVVVESADGLRVRLLDVQLSKPVGEVGLTNVGTPAYLPPDAGVVEWNPSFDLFALGIMVHELVFGRRPERGDILCTVRRVEETELRSEFEKFFGFVLAEASANRPSSTDEFREAWESVITSPQWDAFSRPSP